MSENPVTELQRDRNRLANKAKLRSTEKDIEEIASKIGALIVAINGVTAKNYAYASSYTAMRDALADTWDDLDDDVKSELETFKSQLQGEVADVDDYIDVVRGGDDSGIAPANRELRDLKAKTENAEREIAALLDPVQIPMEQMTRQLELVNWSIDHWNEITADINDGENLIIAADAEWDDDGDKPDGILYLTNQRIIFEQKEKTGKFLGLFGGKQQHETEWTLPLSAITGVRAEDTGMLKQNDMLYLDTTEGNYTLEIKGKSDNDEWLPYINAVKSGKFIIGDMALSGSPSASIAKPERSQSVGSDDDNSGGGAVAAAVVMASGGGGDVPPAGDTAIGDLLPGFEWIDVPGVTKTITKRIPGYAKEGIPPREVTEKISVPAYKVAKFAITNAQWQAFVDAPDGYDNWFWWIFSTDAMQTRRTFPYADPNPGENNARTGICLYDAIAFCRWVSHRTGENVTLPNEGELDHAVESAGAELQKSGANEMTITHMHGEGESLTRSVTSRVAKGKARVSYVNNARTVDLGFRVIQLDGREVDNIKPRLSADKLIEQLRNFDRPMLPHQVPSTSFEIAIYQDPESIPPLLELLDSETKLVRSGAITALMWLARVGTIPPERIINFIATEKEDLPRNRAIRTLIESGEAVIEPVKAQLNHDDAIVRREMIGTLASLQYDNGIEVDGIVEILQKGANDSDKSVAKRAIGWLTRADAKPELVMLLQGKLGDKHLVEDAQRVLESWDVEASVPEIPEPEPVVLDPDLKSSPTKEDVLIEVTADTDIESLLPGVEFVDVPEGEITVTRKVRTGREGTKIKGETFQVSEGVLIAQEPITIEQYQVFLDEAYDNRRWWEYCHSAMQNRETWFKDLSGTTAYADNVSCWTAHAFIFWLSARTGELYRLPYEHEWIQARNENLITPMKHEWVLRPQAGYKIPTYPEMVTAVMRGEDMDYRTETIPIARRDELGFRLVATGEKFEAWVKEMPDIEATMTIAKEKDWTKHTNALRDLAVCADESTVPYLIELLENDDRIVPEVLYWISDRVSLPIAPLVNSLTMRDNSNRRLMVSALKGIGEPAAEPLRQVTKSPDAKLRREALPALVGIVNEDAIELLLELLADDVDTMVRVQAANQLGVIGSAEALAGLEKYSRDPDAKVAKEVNRFLIK